MPLVTITVDVSNALRLVWDWGEQGQVARERLTAAAEEVGALVEALAKTEAPVGAGETGNLRSSHSHRVEDINGVPGAVIGASKFYAPFVHEGRKPGRWPPPGALIGWMRFKDIPEDREFVLRRAIGLRGTRPNRWLRRAAFQAIPRIPGIYERHFKEPWPGHRKI